ncbi:lysophospholipase [Gordonia iterans]|uniref:Lysophospholipase n=1 Tax=Gordonia iterans TaxID=1004901 RepID=A0A2S0KBG0_9ACTN|nr:SGNH/GDSL hydrolase family protein [Gordonia iterans]AVL99026.1 lysophospholipase [Gordonia iterans]
MRFSRFVAIGDSQTEGMCDPDPRYEYRGWADRLAEELSRHNPELRYANLAVRGKNTRKIRAEQVEPALALRPDLITAPLGMNDVIGSSDMSQVHADLDAVYRVLAATGATVLISTFPDVTKTIPLGRRLEANLLALNEMMRGFADRYGFVLVDLHAAPVLTDLRAWAPDRLHASPLGHARFAAGAAYALGVPGSSPEWDAPLPAAPDPHRLSRHARDARWAAQYLAPWMIRKARGRSLGDGRAPKRPLLTPVVESVDVSPAAVTDLVNSPPDQAPRPSTSPITRTDRPRSPCRRPDRRSGW